MPKNRPIISITIPTMNSENTIAACLDSIKKQAFRDYEIIVVDGGSSDETAEIAAQKGAKVIVDTGTLLRARKIGIRQSTGDYVLLLDSDQILTTNALDVCLKHINDHDMLCLGETAVSIVSLSQRLLNSSKKVSQSNLEAYLNPFSGLLIPRFFKRSVLITAMENIRPEAIDIAYDRDHQIIYYEAWKISKNVGFVYDILNHGEPDSIGKVLKKAYRWGYTAGILKSTHTYDILLKKKGSLRIPGHNDGTIVDKLKLLLEANLIAFVKGFPYELGFLIGSLTGVRSG